MMGLIFSIVVTFALVAVAGFLSMVYSILKEIRNELTQMNATLEVEAQSERIFRGQILDDVEGFRVQVLEHIKDIEDWAYTVRPERTPA